VAITAAALITAPTVASATTAPSPAPPLAAVVSAPPGTDPDPQIGDNEFLPEGQDLSNCVGLLQRPGCGSEARGGWRQMVVFGLVVAGLAVVFGRIAVATRARSAAEARAAEQRSAEGEQHRHDA
jgi:hypothetical protein